MPVQITCQLADSEEDCAVATPNLRINFRTEHKTRRIALYCAYCTFLQRI